MPPRTGRHAQSALGVVNLRHPNLEQSGHAVRARRRQHSPPHLVESGRTSGRKVRAEHRSPAEWTRSPRSASSTSAAPISCGVDAQSALGVVTLRRPNLEQSGHAVRARRRQPPPPQSRAERTRSPRSASSTFPASSRAERTRSPRGTSISCRADAQSARNFNLPRSGRTVRARHHQPLPPQSRAEWTHSPRSTSSTSATPISSRAAAQSARNFNLVQRGCAVRARRRQPRPPESRAERTRSPRGTWVSDGVDAQSALGVHNLPGLILCGVDGQSTLGIIIACGVDAQPVLGVINLPHLVSCTVDLHCALNLISSAGHVDAQSAPTIITLRHACVVRCGPGLRLCPCGALGCPITIPSSDLVVVCESQPMCGSEDDSRCVPVNETVSGSRQNIDTICIMDVTTGVQS
ncbi:hypothetical protein CALCODRAFT_506174 [Calocera cornea HHB12733]|uniref:Uncharacterized protein n=1 Tax=Calocera cornea HHB12733 TaxID=1353952 RepID=A0A165JBF1_9BASI|nr:hypothetical protein CALCODRAFT_506174 [Calocera cornea HHB12733]